MRRARGMTLLEVLVAVAIFAVLALLAYGALGQIALSRARLQEDELARRELIRWLDTLTADLGQAAPRPARGAYGDPEPAFIGRRDGFTLTRIALRSTRAGPVEVAQRVEQGWHGGQWRRVVYAAVDRAPATPGRSALGLTAVDAVEIRYYADSGTVSNQWPPPGVELPLEALPRAVEISVELARFGRLRRLIEVSDAGPR